MTAQAASSGSTVWFTPDRVRYFLLADPPQLPAGDMALHSIAGRQARVDPASVVPYEVTEAQAYRWAANELAITLGELRSGVDQRLDELRKRLDDWRRAPVDPGSPVRASAAGAMISMFTALPKVILDSLSANADRIAAARAAMSEHHERLHASGLDVGDSVRRFPDRLAALRAERAPRQ